MSTKSSVYIIGGWTGVSHGTSHTLSKIVEFRFEKLENKMGNWFEVGDLKYSRRGHVAITHGSKILIYGGKGSDFSLVKRIEIWEIQPTGEMINLKTLRPSDFELKPSVSKRELKLSLSAIYEDILFVVENGFCKNN